MTSMTDNHYRRLSAICHTFTEGRYSRIPPGAAAFSGLAE